MPIDIETFERSPADALRTDQSSDDDPILEFLAYNPEKAYTLREIQSAVDLPIIDIAARLTRLKAEGAVRQKGSYWAVKERIVEDADSAGG